MNMISHPIKVWLKVDKNLITESGKEAVAEKQVGVFAGKSTIEQIFNGRILTNTRYIIMMIYTIINRPDKNLRRRACGSCYKHLEEGLLCFVKALYYSSRSSRVFT